MHLKMGCMVVWCVIGFCRFGYAEVSDVRVVPVENEIHGFVSQDILFTAHERLLGAAMYMKLVNGSIYDHPLGNGQRPPVDVLIKSDPNLAFDSYFDGPTDGSLIFPTGPIIEDHRMFGVWGALGSSQTGEIRAARITLSEDASEAIGLLRLVTDDEVSDKNSYFISADQGQVVLSPFVTESILAGEHELTGTQALTLIANPGTTVSVPKNSLLMHDVTVDTPIRIENEAIVRFDGGYLYNPTSTAILQVESNAELHIRDGDLRSGGVEVRDGGLFTMSGGALRVAIFPSDFGVHAEDAKVQISGGEVFVGKLTTDNELTVTGGSISVTRELELSSGAEAAISGGDLEIDELLSVTDSHLRVIGGQISTGLLRVNNGTVSLVGADISSRTVFDPPSLEPPKLEWNSDDLHLTLNDPFLPLPELDLEESGHIAGTLADGSPFSWDYQLYDGGKIVLNPEPDSLGLFVSSWLLGLCLWLRRGRSSIPSSL